MRTSLRQFHALASADATYGDATALLRRMYRLAQRLAARRSELAQAYLAGIRASIADLERLRAAVWGTARRPSRQRAIVWSADVGTPTRPSVQPPAL